MKNHFYCISIYCATKILTISITTFFCGCNLWVILAAINSVVKKLSSNKTSCFDWNRSDVEPLINTEYGHANSFSKLDNSNANSISSPSGWIWINESKSDCYYLIKIEILSYNIPAHLSSIKRLIQPSTKKLEIEKLSI